MNNEICESMKEIGNRARAARRFLRLTQQTVADHLGMKRQSYIEIEKGRRRLMATEIPILCNLIRMTPNDLLGFLADNQNGTMSMPRG